MAVAPGARQPAVDTGCTMTPVRLLCTACLERFQRILTAHRPTGTLRYSCRHHGVTLTAYVEHGAVMNWSLASGTPHLAGARDRESAGPAIEDGDPQDLPMAQGKKH